MSTYMLGKDIRAFIDGGEYRVGALELRTLQGQ